MPASLVIITLVLAVMAWLEESVLSPRAVILYTVRSRAARPEHAELLVAQQAERLLQSRPR